MPGATSGHAFRFRPARTEVEVKPPSPLKKGAGISPYAPTFPVRSSLPQPTIQPPIAELIARSTTQYMIWR